MILYIFFLIFLRIFFADVGTQEIYEINQTVHDAQNALSPTMVDNTGVVIILLL